MFTAPNLFKNLVINDNSQNQVGSDGAQVKSVIKPLLHFVVESINDQDLIEILDICLRFEFNPNIQNNINETALHICMKQNQFCCQITELLIAGGANPCLITTPRVDKGMNIGRETPLHYLTKRKSEMNGGTLCNCI